MRHRTSPRLRWTACAAAWTAALYAAPVTAQVKNPVAWQAALDRAGFSPGIIDGLIGKKTRLALRAYQTYYGLPVTGQPDRATARSLDVDGVAALVRYRITPDDAARIGRLPDDWNDRAKLRKLPYPSLSELVAERGHCSQALLARLNPGIDLSRLGAGDSVLIPRVGDGRILPAAARVDIEFDRRLILVRDGSGKVAAMFHCSIARDTSKRPSGPCRVVGVTHNPEYLFDPKYWPEVTNVSRRLRIPPGPRSPVGDCWIGLSIDGYGIHGTPKPELIGKTGSHGCFRLTNWDVTRVASVVRPGTEVRFISGGATFADGR